MWSEVYLPAAPGRATWLASHLHLIDTLVLAPPPLVHGTPCYFREESAATMAALQGVSRLEASARILNPESLRRLARVSGSRPEQVPEPVALP